MMQRLIPLVFLIGVASCDSDGITEPEAGLNRIRESMAVYADISKAQAAGYTVWSPDPAAVGATCPSSAEGKMGYHLVNVSLRGAVTNPQAGDAVLDPTRPEMLIYEKRPDGTLGLVGVEWLVFKAAWEREKGAGAAAPTVLGVPVPLSDHTFAPGGPSIPHYELHAWVFKDNPRGMFEPYHPGVTC